MTRARPALPGLAAAVAGGLLTGAVLAGCGGGGEPPAEEVPAATTAGAEQTEAAATSMPSSEAGHAANPWPGRSGLGTKAESPVSACGPEDSYRFVAAEFVCPGGGNPLGGDPRAGAAVRVGNVGENSTGHIVDHYRVPCPGGEVDVFVDMYGCPEMEARLRAFQGGS